MNKSKKIILLCILGLIIVFLSVLFVLLPSLYLDALNNSYLLILFKNTLIFLVFILLAVKAKKYKFLKNIIIALTASYYTLVYFVICYVWCTSAILNPYFFIDSYSSIVDTGIQVFGLAALSLISGCFVILFILLFIILSALLKVFSDFQNTYLKFSFLRSYLFIIPSLIVIPLFPADTDLLSYHYEIIKKYSEARSFFAVSLATENTKIIKTISQATSTDNFFILQLESLNAMVLNGRIETEVNKDHEILAPNLNKISRDGIFFPSFWSNNIQTINAQENILCGIVNNMNPGFSLTDEQAEGVCLPHILKKLGYKTIVFRADNLKFQRMGAFFDYLGYEEIHYDDIMKPGDKKYLWGYDDCIFYQRSFEYLKKNYPNSNKLFVYFEVSTNHLPFKGKNEYKFTHKFSPANNFTEDYVNSVLEQDYCLDDFYKEFRSYQPQKTNLMILGDTSWPQGLNDGNYFNMVSAYNENFLTFFTFIPAEEKKDLYNVGKIINNAIYAHSDILPTLMEIATGAEFKNSFAFELLKNKKNQNYETCQILTQPYTGGKIAVIDNQTKYIYNLTEQTLTSYDLATDMLEKHPLIENKYLSFEDFKKEYFCSRFK